MPSPEAFDMLHMWKYYYVKKVGRLSVAVCVRPTTAIKSYRPMKRINKLHLDNIILLCQKGAARRVFTDPVHCQLIAATAALLSFQYRPPWHRSRAGGQKGIILYRLGESDSPAIVQSILYRNLHTPHKQPYPYLACPHTCPQSLRMPSSGSSRCCQG